MLDIVNRPGTIGGLRKAIKPEVNNDRETPDSIKCAHCGAPIAFSAGQVYVDGPSYTCILHRALPPEILEALQDYADYQYQLSEGSGRAVTAAGKVWEKTEKALKAWLAENLK